jgi:hypothetical protein
MFMKAFPLPSPAFCAVFVAVLSGANHGAVASNSILFSGSGVVQGENLSATANFTDLGGGNLEVTLANTYTGDTPDQAAVLTGVFFDFSGAAGLAPETATASAGSIEWDGGAGAGTPYPAPTSAVLGGEWAYGTGSIGGGPAGINAGIVSSGYYTPGHGNFPNGNPAGVALDGSSFGILSAGYAGSNMDGLKSQGPYVQNSIDFILSGFSGSVSGISDVSFQYGTSLSEPNLPAVVPEPGIATLVSFGAAALLMLRRKNGTR